MYILPTSSFQSHSNAWLSPGLTETKQIMRRVLGKIRVDFVPMTSELQMSNCNQITFLFLFILSHSYSHSCLPLYLRLPHLVLSIWPHKQLAPRSILGQDKVVLFIGRGSVEKSGSWFRSPKPPSSTSGIESSFHSILQSAHCGFSPDIYSSDILLFQAL